MFEKSIMDTLHFRPNVLLLRMGKVPFLDITGESNLASLVKHFKSLNGIILIAGLKKQPKDVLKRTGLFSKIGENHFFEHSGEAIDYALTQLDFNKCLGCKHFAFHECTSLSDPLKQPEMIASMGRVQPQILNPVLKIK